MTHPTHDDAARFAADAAMDAPCPTCANATGRGLTANANAGNSADAPCPTCAGNGADKTTGADINGVSTRRGTPATDALRTVASRPFSERADIEILRQRDVDLFDTVFSPVSHPPIANDRNGADVEQVHRAPGLIDRLIGQEKLIEKLWRREHQESSEHLPPDKVEFKYYDSSADSQPPGFSLPTPSPPPTTPIRRRDVSLFGPFSSPMPSESDPHPFTPPSLDFVRFRLGTRYLAGEPAPPATPPLNVFDKIMERLYSGTNGATWTDFEWAHLEFPRLQWSSPPHPPSYDLWSDETNASAIRDNPYQRQWERSDLNGFSCPELEAIIEKAILYIHWIENNIPHSLEIDNLVNSAKRVRDRALQRLLEKCRDYAPIGARIPAGAIPCPPCEGKSDELLVEWVKLFYDWKILAEDSRNLNLAEHYSRCVEHLRQCLRARGTATIQVGKSGLITFPPARSNCRCIVSAYPFMSWELRINGVAVDLLGPNTPGFALEANDASIYDQPFDPFLHAKISYELSSLMGVIPSLAIASMRSTWECERGFDWGGWADNFFPPQVSHNDERSRLKAAYDKIISHINSTAYPSNHPLAMLRAAGNLGAKLEICLQQTLLIIYDYDCTIGSIILQRTKCFDGTHVTNWTPIVAQFVPEDKITASIYFFLYKYYRFDLADAATKQWLLNAAAGAAFIFTQYKFLQWLLTQFGLPEWLAGTIVDFIPIIGDIKGIFDLIEEYIKGELSLEWLIALLILSVLLLFFPGVTIGVLKAILWPFKQAGKFIGAISPNILKELFAKAAELITKAREFSSDIIVFIQKKLSDLIEVVRRNASEQWNNLLKFLDEVGQFFQGFTHPQPALAGAGGGTFSPPTAFHSTPTPPTPGTPGPPLGGGSSDSLFATAAKVHVGGAIPDPGYKGNIRCGAYDPDTNSLYIGQGGHFDGASNAGLTNVNSGSQKGITTLEQVDTVYWSNDSQSMPRALTSDEAQSIQKGLETAFPGKKIIHVGGIDEIPKPQ